MGAAVRPAAVETTRRRPSTAIVVGGCLALAAGSLALPVALAFDPWAWLVWGREVGRWALDTTGGPSWKPLPVVASTILAPLGDLAPPVWLVVSRAGGLLGLVLTWKLATRFAGPAAGAIAAGLLVLTPDGGPRFTRLLLEGHWEPLTVTLGLAAVDRHLDGRPAHALLLGAGVGLLRPEAWPFLLLYALWLGRALPVRLAVSVAVALPVLWFVPDWWGSGDLLHGPAAARVVSGGVWELTTEALDRAARMVVLPVWPLAAVGAVAGLRRHRPATALLVGGALAWSLIVVAMSSLGEFAALSRFFLPAAALLCVAAGIGAVRLAEAASARAATLGAAVALLLVVAVAPFVAGRAGSLGTILEDTWDRARIEADLEVLVDRAGGREQVLACGPVRIDHERLGGASQPALAWRLDVPLHEVGAARPVARDSALAPLGTPPPSRAEREATGAVPVGPGTVVARAGGRIDRLLAGAPEGAAVEVTRTDQWALHRVGCDSDLGLVAVPTSD